MFKQSVTNIICTIKNNIKTNSTCSRIPINTLGCKILNYLLREGFLANYKIMFINNKKYAEIELRVSPFFRTSSIRDIKMLSVKNNKINIKNNFKKSINDNGVYTSLIGISNFSKLYNNNLGGTRIFGIR